MNTLTKIKEYYFIIIVLFLYAIFFLFISPLREFTVADAWYNATAVKDFLTTHQIKIPQFSSSSLVFQILWGAFFCYFSKGFSFSMLNLSTFLLSLAGTISFYLILRRLKFKEILCVLGTLCLMLSPLYFFLSYTFLTDLPCFSLMLISLFFYLKGLDDDNNKILFLGSIFSALSFLTKQYGILIPLAIAIHMVILYKNNHKMLFNKIISGCLLPLCVFVIYLIWFLVFFLPNSSLAFYSPIFPKYFMYQNLFNYVSGKPDQLLWILAYSGFFASPLLLGCPIVFEKIYKNKKILLYGIFITFIIVIGAFISFARGPIYATDNLMPYMGGIINKWGLGPISIVGNKSIYFNFIFKLLITIISVLSALILTIAFIIWAQKYLRNNSRNIIFIAGILQMAVMLFLLPGFWDYDLVFFLPISILLTLDLAERIKFNYPSIILGLCLMAFYSICGTKDYMNWNEVRWKAANQLLKEKVPPNRIEGGFEWSGFLFSDSAAEKFRKELEAGVRVGVLYRYRWLGYVEPKYDPIYIISFSPSLDKGEYLNRLCSIRTTSLIESKYKYSMFRKMPYYNMLRFRKEYIYVLKREDT